MTHIDVDIIKYHQGSLAAVVYGNTVERLSYDPWGRRRNTTGFGYGNVSHTFDRGYTLHEHYDGFDLINMNGRIYDPMMSSFLSVDRFVQNPETAQGFNRYAYCMHNPLRYVDPSGWEMRKPVPGRTPNTSDFYMDPHAFAERALEPRDLGILQLPTSDPSVVWMEENEMHGGSGRDGNEGGFYVNLASGLIEYHEGQTDLECLKLGLVFLADNNASVGDIESALEQKGLTYEKDPRVIGGFLVDTEELFKGFLLWQSIPSMTMVLALGSLECFLNSVSLLPAFINNTKSSAKIAYEFTNTTLEHMNDSDRRVPLYIIDEVIKNPQIVTKDPRGTTALKYYSTMYRNGKLYNIEVLYKKSNNTIYHFLYNSGTLGPLPPIKP